MDLHYSLQRHNVRFTKLPLKWIDGLFLGNGEIGAMIWGNGNPLKITLDKADYWENRMDPRGQFGPDHNWEDMQRLIHAGDYAGLRQKYELYGAAGNADHWPVQPTRLPVPRLELNFGHPLHGWDMQIDLSDGAMRGTLSHPIGTLKFQGYIHAERNFMVFTCRNPTGPIPAISVKVDDTHLSPIAKANLKAWGYPNIAQGQEIINQTQMHYAYQELPENQGGLLISWVIFQNEHDFA